MSKWCGWLLCGMALLCGTAGAVGFLDSDSIWDFTGETTAGGSVRCEMVDAPGKPGLKTLKLTFRKKEHKQDWLDVRYTPLQIRHRSCHCGGHRLQAPLRGFGAV